MGKHVRAGHLDVWTEQVGQGPDVLLIGGAGDTVESWQFQLDGLMDRYRLTAFDNRGAGRTATAERPVSVEMMADDAAGVLRALDVSSAHVAGFSGGSIIAQEVALRHPELVRSLVLQSTWPAMDAYLRAWLLFIRWLVEVARANGRFSRDSSWISTRRGRTTTGPSHSSSRRCSRFRTSNPPKTYRASLTRSSTTTRPTALLKSRLQHSYSPVVVTRPRARPSAAPSRSGSLGPDSTLWRRRPTSPSRRFPTNGTPESTRSGARLRPRAEAVARYVNRDRVLVPGTDARRSQRAELAAVRGTGLMWANVLRAFQVGKARMSHEGPWSWMRRSPVASAQVSRPACHLTKASASAVT
jgi:pimeloyl-ACP methyl ester carboxylesterase